MLFDGLPIYVKLAIGAGLFSAGVLIGGVGVHKVWNGHIKDQKIKHLEREVDLKDSAYEAEKLVTQAYKSINEGFEKAIKAKDGEIQNYATANVSLANSRAGTREVIYREGRSISNEEQSKDPKDPINYCLGVAVNERLRGFANGE